MRKLISFFIYHFESASIILIFIGIFIVAFIVQYKFSFLNFFFLPVILSGYFFGKRRSVLTGILCILLVVLFLVFYKFIYGQEKAFSTEEVINLITWGSFLILTGAIMGVVSEQRERKIKNLRRAYIGALEILLKYLEVVDEERPRSLRVSLLSGKIAEAAGLSTAEVENIKSAALLYEAGDLHSSLPFFEEVSDFMEKDMRLEGKFRDREEVMLKTTASLLKEIEPILASYFLHYVEEANIMDKNLDKIPIGSSIIALADTYDHISREIPLPPGREGIKTLGDIKNLSGRSFPDSAVQALLQVVYSIQR